VIQPEVENANSAVKEMSGELTVIVQAPENLTNIHGVDCIKGTPREGVVRTDHLNGNHDPNNRSNKISQKGMGYPNIG